MGPNEFIHCTAPENHLILESICPYCNLAIGASSKLELLQLLERTHRCHKRIAIRLLQPGGDAPTLLS
jgi:hypothetical protein